MRGAVKKKLRRLARVVFTGDCDRVWASMLAVPWRGRVRLAWRLICGRNMDGSRTIKEAT